MSVYLLGRSYFSGMQVVLNMTQYLGRFIRAILPYDDYNNGDINFYRGDGKIRSVPLHTWLPDAMEGPTPVSALIHAATMVAAGVYLVATMFPLFSASAVAMQTVAIVGAFTAHLCGFHRSCANGYKESACLFYS